MVYQERVPIFRVNSVPNFIFQGFRLAVFASLMQCNSCTVIAPDKAIFQLKIQCFSYFSMKSYVVVSIIRSASPRRF